jgi:hypothetical protein
MNINKWKQSGNIYIWRYRDNPKNYQGWHLSANNSGCISISELLQALIDSPPEANRTVQLSVPTDKQFCVPNCNRKPIAETKLRMVKSGISEEWSLTKNEDKLQLDIGTVYLHKFISGLADIQRNKGDYFIGRKDQELWFWW